MKNNEIIEKLSSLHLQSFSLEDFDNELQLNKEHYVSIDDQQQAKLLWIYQTIVKIHSEYRQAFDLLKAKKYYDGWCKLERVEIIFRRLKKHFSFDKSLYYLWHIEKSVKNLQVLFPYRLFASSELLKKKKICSVCDKEVTIRNSCSHIVGEIYNGEMCYRVVTESEVLGIALVENPGNKYSVMFLKDEKTDAQIDHYNYDTIDYLFDLINWPYESWDLEVSEKEVKDNSWGKVGRNDTCPCGLNKKYKNCCMKKKIPHYEFIVTNPTNKRLLTNTLKS